MTTAQIIGVSIAGAAVLLLVIALVVRRRGRGGGEQDETGSRTSFLDEGPQDTFAALGKPEQPVEDITLDPAVERAAEERAAAEEGAGGEGPVVAVAPVREERRPQPGGLGLDWGPDLSVRELGPDPAAVPPSDDETEITGELGTTHLSADQANDAPPAPEGDGEDQTAAPESARPAEGGPVAEEAAQESDPGSRLVPLSDIIVTTSGKLVDLQDPEVRRMLTELVTFEIDQAAEFRRRGQTIDAVLQLTEAEKISRALGMTEAARRIHAMMREINEQE